MSGKRYMLEFSAVAVAYVVTLFVSISLLRQMAEDDPLRWVLAVLPAIPILFGIWVVLRQLARIDELQRRIQLEAFGFSLGMTGFITFTVGLLENAGLPQFGLIWVFPMLIAFWGIGTALAGWRYR